MTNNIYILNDNKQNQIITNKIYNVLWIMANKYMSRYLKCQRRHQPVVSPNADMQKHEKRNKQKYDNDKQNLYQMIASQMYIK